MLITRTGEQLRTTLAATLERLTTHEAQTRDFIEKHRAEHVKERADYKGDCTLLSGVRSLLAQMNAERFRLHAMRDALDPAIEYTLSMKNYVAHYATLPYDSLSLPDPETTVRTEHLGAFGGLRSSLLSTN